MADPMYPDLRMWEPTDSEAKHVDDTKMLNCTARETPDTVTAENKNEELVNPTPKFGKLGAQGRE
jgi:hypothetical protein